MPPKSKGEAKGKAKAKAAHHAGLTKRNSIMDLEEAEDPMNLKLPTYEDGMQMTPANLQKEIDILMTKINQAKLNLNHIIAETQEFFVGVDENSLKEFKKFTPPKKIDMKADAPIIGVILTMQISCYMLSGEDHMDSSLDVLVGKITSDPKIVEKMMKKLEDIADTGHHEDMLDVAKMKDLMPVYQRSCFNPNGVETLIPVAKPFCKWVLTMCEAYWENHKRDQRSIALQALKKAKHDLMRKSLESEGNDGELVDPWRISLMKFHDAGGERLQKLFEFLQAAEDEAAELAMSPCAKIQLNFMLQSRDSVNVQNAEMEQKRIRSMVSLALQDEYVQPEHVSVTFKKDGTVSCEIRVMDSSTASVQRALDVKLSDYDSVFYSGEPAGPNMRKGFYSVEVQHPIGRITKAVNKKFGLKLQDSAVEKFVDFIDDAQKKYHQMVQEVEKVEPDEMAELMKITDKGMYQGRLRPCAEAHHAGLGEDWIKQPANNIKDLLELAKKAQRNLKKSISKDLGIWAKTEMNDVSLVPLTAPKRTDVFGVSDEDGNSKFHAYDPGIKATKKLEEKAKSLQKPYHLNPPYEQVFDSARISQAYETVEGLVAGIRADEAKSEVVFVENHFKTTKGFGYPHVLVGVQIDGMITEKTFSLRDILPPKDHRKGLHDLIAAQNVNSEHIAGVSRTIFEQLDRTEGDDMRQANLQVAEMGSLMEPVIAQIQRTLPPLLEPHEVEDVKKWVASCQVRPVIADLQRALQSGDVEQLQHAMANAEKVQELRTFYKMDCKLLSAELKKAKDLLAEINNINNLTEHARCCQLTSTQSGPNDRAAILKAQIAETITTGTLQDWHPGMLRAKAFADFLEKLGHSVGIDDEIEKVICREQSTDDLSLSRDSVRHRAEQLRQHASKAVAEKKVGEGDEHVTRALAVAKELDILEDVAQLLEDHFVSADIDTLTKSLNDIHSVGQTPLLIKLPLPAVRASTARFTHTSEALLDLHTATAALDEVATTAKRVRETAIDMTLWPPVMYKEARSRDSKPKPRAAVHIKRAQLWAQLREMERRLGAQAEESWVAEGNPILERAKISFGHAKKALELCEELPDSLKEKNT